MRIYGLPQQNPRIYSAIKLTEPSKATAHSNDTFEKQTTTKSDAAPKQYASRWDIPGVYTYDWISSISQNLSAKGDYGSQIGKYTGGLMVLASPVVVPLSLVADAINTVIFSGKLLMRYFL